MPVEYAFINNYTALKMSDELLSRAVRVKTTVKDKIERVYSKSAETLTKEVKLESLVDNSVDALNALNEKLNAMHNQKNVPVIGKRAVLFTKPLVEKISKMSDSWIKIEDNVKEEVPTPVVSEPVAIENPVATPTIETPAAPVVHQIPQTVTENIEQVIPGNWDSVTASNTMAPVVETPKVETVLAIETPAVKEEITPVVPLVEAAPVVNEVEKEPVLDKSMSIEDKISELLNRKPELSEEMVKEPVLLTNNNLSFEDKNGDNVPDSIMDRLQQVNNDIKERDSLNAELQEKVSELQEKNDKLVIDSAKSELELRAKIANLEGQITFLKQSHADKRNEMSTSMSRLKEKFDAEMDALKAQKDIELKEALAAKDKQISVIYKTISEALGETSVKDSERSLAA